MYKSLLIEGLREVFYSDPARIGMTWEVAKGAPFSFPSLAAYEAYRQRLNTDYEPFP
jgi:hypothetical protein